MYSFLDAFKSKTFPNELVKLVKPGLLIAVACFYIQTAFSLGVSAFDGAPDEVMRSLIPRCIINGNLLPSGYDQCAIFSAGNWSYAFYPQMLSGYCSAFFMAIAKAMGFSRSIIFMSGRLTSVLCGLISIYFLSKTVGLIFSEKRSSALLECLAIVLLGFWPQFAFISSYMNNDIFALAGVFIIVYSLVSGMKQTWNYGLCVLLAVGVAMSGLGYWNSYGFILVGVIVFIVSTYIQNKNSLSKAFRLIGVAGGLSALFVLPWFVVNFVRYGDFVGMAIFHERQTEWVQLHGQDLQSPYLKGLGSLLTDTDFVEYTISSFVGVLGGMTIHLQFMYQFVYYLLMGGGIALTFTHLRARWTSRTYRILFLGLSIASAITVLLLLYYNLRVDYQPQGRYIIYLLVPFMLALLTGIGDSFSLETKNEKVVLFVLCIIYVWICLNFFHDSALKYNWHGIDWSTISWYGEL